MSFTRPVSYLYFLSFLDSGNVNGLTDKLLMGRKIMEKKDEKERKVEEEREKIYKVKEK